MWRIVCSICKICSTCKWVCNCWMRDYQAKTANEVFERNNSLLSNIDDMNKVVELVKKWYKTLDILNAVWNFEEIVRLEPIIAQSEYCEYPVWSWWLWAWVDCLKCGKPRFEWRWKKCEWVPL